MLPEVMLPETRVMGHVARRLERLPFKDDETAPSKPSTESLGLSEKEITRILGSQTFTEIPGGLDSLETVGENYFCVLLFSNKVSLFKYQ